MTTTWDDLAAVIDLAPAMAPPRSRTVPPGQKQAAKTVSMRRQASKSMRNLAGQMPEAHPGTEAGQHVRDAARTLDAGDEDAAQRHLRAAMFALTPQSLHRNGIHDDIGHIAARQAMHGVHRHLLLVKDIADTRNRTAIAKQAPPPARTDPNAGYGPGALAQKPTARQPGGDQALNAPATTNSGGSDPAAADPAGPQPKGSKQFAGGGHVRTTDLARGTGKHPLAGRMSKAQLVQHLTSFHHRLAGPGSQPTVKAMQARHAVLHRVMAAASPDAAPGIPHTHGAGSVPEAAGVSSFARTWGEVGAAIDLSAKTGALAATPAPYGKPDGPGLYGVKGQKHSDYFESVVQALMRKRGMDKGKASAIAYGALRKWRAGGGKVHSEVRAAAGGALAEEAVKHGHGHANSRDELSAAIVDLAEVRGTSGQWISNPSKAQWAGIDARTGKSLPDMGDDDEAKADNHIRAARQSSAIGQHAVAIKHLARASTLTSDPGKQAAINTLSTGVARNAIQTGQGRQLGMARTWGEVGALVVDLAVQPAGQAAKP